MECPGPSKSNDIQLIIIKVAAGNLRVPKEVAARYTDIKYHA